MTADSASTPNRIMQSGLVEIPVEYMDSLTIGEPEFLPPEIIMEILSWLPLKYLSQAQLVCKKWRELINDHHFTGKHMNHNAYVGYWHNNIVISHGGNRPESDSFCYLHGCDGLLLMKNNLSQKHFLWNPATHRVLELPDPHSYNYGFALCFVPSTRNYRIVAIYGDDESWAECCQVFTPGYSKAWRPLPFPNVNTNGHREIETVTVVSAGGVVHCVLAIITEDEELVHEIVSLDLETESFTVNCLPQGVFENYETIWELDWNGKLALAIIIGQTLEVMELEDYKKGRWCPKKKAIHLTFMEKYNYHQRNVVPLFAKNGDIWFWLKKKTIVSWTIETGRIVDVKRSEAFSRENNLYIYKPSLIGFEGMQPDTNMERFRPSRFD